MVSFAVIAVIYSQSVTPMFHAYFCLGDSAFDTLQSRKKITLSKTFLYITLFILKKVSSRVKLNLATELGVKIHNLWLQKYFP